MTEFGKPEIGKSHFGKSECGKSGIGKSELGESELTPGDGVPGGAVQADMQGGRDLPSTGGRPELPHLVQLLAPAPTLRDRGNLTCVRRRVVATRRLFSVIAPKSFRVVTIFRDSHENPLASARKVSGTRQSSEKQTAIFRDHAAWRPGSGDLPRNRRQSSVITRPGTPANAPQRGSEAPAAGPTRITAAGDVGPAR